MGICVHSTWCRSEGNLQGSGLLYHHPGCQACAPGTHHAISHTYVNLSVFVNLIPLLSLVLFHVTEVPLLPHSPSAFISLLIYFHTHSRFRTIISFKIYFICVCMCWYHMSAGAFRGQKRVQIPLEQQMTVSRPTWVLGTESGPLESSILTAEPSLQPQQTPSPL